MTTRRATSNPIRPFTPWLGVLPNSAAHRTLLWLGAAVSVVFNVAILVDGAFRAGYDWLRQPMSALSLGPEGWMQVTGFIVFGIVQCATAPAWRASLRGGSGVAAYPVIRVISGLAMIIAGVFSQDPSLGYPQGVPAPASPSMHAVVHQGVSFVSLSAAVAGLIVLGIRFAREPEWRGWAPWAFAAAVAMMVSLALFGTLVGTGGPGGIFEKIASWMPTLFGLAVTVRLLAGDAQVATAPERG